MTTTATVTGGGGGGGGERWAAEGGGGGGGSGGVGAEAIDAQVYLSGLEIVQGAAAPNLNPPPTPTSP